MDKAAELGKQLRDSFDRWNTIYTYGGSDPFWEDGCNLNLVRNHIIHFKKQCENELLPVCYPEEYYIQTPPEVDSKYMARQDEIRQHAKESLTAYKEDEDYKYLLKAVKKLTVKQKEQSLIENVLGYVSGLAQYIERDLLVDMRRHEYPERYIDSFKNCRKRIAIMLKDTSEKEIQPGQISLFDLFEDVMGVKT